MKHPDEIDKKNLKTIGRVTAVDICSGILLILVAFLAMITKNHYVGVIGCALGGFGLVTSGLWARLANREINEKLHELKREVLEWLEEHES